MGMGAPKPGSTLPPQGGKGGVQQPVQPQVPARREGLGQMFPNYTFPRGPSNQPTPRPQVQPPTPAPGGKTAAPGTIFNPNNPNNVPMPGGKGAVQPGQPQVPAQGGKGRDFGPNVFPGPQQPINSGMSPDLAAKYAEMERMRAGQVPGQVPAQGGKTPLTPEQQAALGPYVSPARPQVMPMSPQQSPYYDANGRPTAVGTGGPGALMRPQVLPMKPMPANQAQGLAGLQNILYGGKR